MDLQLTDRAVIVCASSGGLGKAAALEFAREGANVMLCGRREAELQKAAEEIKASTGREARYTVADVTQPDDIARLVDNTVSTFGGVFTLINNSGGPPAGTFDQFDDSAWQKAFELNLLSYVRAIRAVLPHMRSGGGGRIVNYTSSSVKSPLDNLILSNTFRMGVLGMAKTLSGELGKDGILINVLGPGRILTDRIEQLDAIRAEKTGSTLDQVRTDTYKTIPLGRYGVPGEFAKLTVFLGSPANSYITGQTVLVEGGMVRAY
jgi:3-oxoacyl-[acyl-carrier protein] reductase